MLERISVFRCQSDSLFACLCFLRWLCHSVLSSRSVQMPVEEISHGSERRRHGFLSTWRFPSNCTDTQRRWRLNKVVRKPFQATRNQSCATWAYKHDAPAQCCKLSSPIQCLWSKFPTFFVSGGGWTCMKHRPLYIRPPCFAQSLATIGSSDASTFSRMRCRHCKNPMAEPRGTTAKKLGFLSDLASDFKSEFPNKTPLNVGTLSCVKSGEATNFTNFTKTP